MNDERDRRLTIVLGVWSAAVAAMLAAGVFVVLVGLIAWRATERRPSVKPDVPENKERPFFDRVAALRDGMSFKEVEEEMGTRGTFFEAQFNKEIYFWFSKGDYVKITFWNGRLIRKETKEEMNEQIREQERKRDRAERVRERELEHLERERAKRELEGLVERERLHAPPPPQPMPFQQPLLPNHAPARRKPEYRVPHGNGF